MPSSTPALPPVLPPARRAAGRRAVAALAGAAAAVLLAGCGVRLETPPPVAPSPDAAEELRQDTAADAATIAATVSEVTADGAGAQLLDRVGAEADAHLEALGGVWAPWPDGAPEGAVTPAPVPTAPPGPDPDVADVVDLLTRGAAQAREDAVAAPTDELAAVLAAVSISRTQAAADLARAGGQALPESPAAPLQAEALLARGVDGPTLLVLDQARFAWETVAARSAGPAREAATARADHLQTLVDVAVEAGAPDGRLGVYGLPGADEEAGLSAEQAAVVDAESRLLEHWLFSLGLVGPEERAALVDAAADSAQRVVDAGGTLPALPGLEQPGA
ncbi:uncharacterized protein DUF4439 [Georgenia soli]|uniref:Uncharacterized protein DUF4439 n=1 Tax=Georgenia soli TaxID=638953 RepID=A0A2A9EHE1_9MICO|nr:DUF4439 domain-containing protein [Georgenia soli]PFG38477.1 uncharacterized protein DUF4439 [Georgenia soli]